MDRVFIRELKISTVIGVYDWERRVRQVVVIDIEMATDNRAAAASDGIDDALNYAAVAARIEGFVGDSQFQLIETMAERVAEIILNEFQVPWVCVRLAKPGAVRAASEVGVQIERGELRQ